MYESSPHSYRLQRRIVSFSDPTKTLLVSFGDPRSVHEICEFDFVQKIRQLDPDQIDQRRPSLHRTTPSSPFSCKTPQVIGVYVRLKASVLRWCLAGDGRLVGRMSERERADGGKRDQSLELRSVGG